MRLYRNDIVSCVYREKLRIVRIEEVRNLTKNPVENSTSEHFTEAKYLYTVLEYGGCYKSFYDAGMTEITILSNKHFINASLNQRFDKFRGEHRKKAEAHESKLTAEENAERLMLGDIPSGTKVRVVLYNGKTKTGRYGEHRAGVIYVLNGGINTYTGIQTTKIRSIELLEVQLEAPKEVPEQVPDPYSGLAQSPRFGIPDYEKKLGYSTEFWNAFVEFAKTMDLYPGHKYRFILSDGGHFDKRISRYYKLIATYPIDGDDIIITLIADNGKEKEFSLSVFKEIILLPTITDRVIPVSRTESVTEQPLTNCVPI